MMRLRALGESLRADFNAATERGRLVRSAGNTAALKVGATLLAFGASLLYARVLGPHGYGLYAYVLAWVAVLTIPAGLGMPAYLVREGAKAVHSVRSLCLWSDKRIVVSGAATAAFMMCVVFLPSAAGARWLFVIAAPLPLLNSLGDVRRSLLQSLGWVARSQWPVLILAPTIMLATLAILWAYQKTLYPIEVVAAMTGAALVPLFINELQLRRIASFQEIRRPSARLRSAFPFIWLGGLYLLNNRADLIMLGTMEGAHAAGIYAVSARAAELVTFFLVASNMVIAPRIARLYAENNRALLQRLLTGAARRVLAMSVPVALVFIFAAQPLLSLLYGAGYAEGALALQILAGAQLVQVALGPTGTILNMTGNEKLSMLGAGMAVVLNIVLNAALIPLLGVTGAAIGTAASLAIWNIVLWFWIRQRIHLRPTGIGI
ncbi:MAG TPA: flippase [Gammaproteobacteria bacterium]|nr:flippase [Gammaproteobacteria bacterium]